MALRDLLSALDAEMQAEQDADAERRQTAADEVLAAARRTGDAEYDRAVADHVARAEDDAASVVAAAQADARRARARAHREHLAAVHEEALRRLAKLPGTTEGTAAARTCAAEALAALPGADTIRLHPADRAAVAALDGARLVDDLDDGGALAEGPDGSFVDNTFGTRLANLWPGLAVELGQRWGVDP